MTNKQPDEPSLSFGRSRQAALLRTIEQQAEISGDNSIQIDSCITNPILACIIYAQYILGSISSIVDVDGDIVDILEANNIPFRQVKTPSDLCNTTRNLLISFAVSDGRPLVIYRKGGKTVFYDSLCPTVIGNLTRDIDLKPFSFEIYPNWPDDLRTSFQLLGFSFHGNFYPLLAVVFGSIVVALFNLFIPALTKYLTGTILPSGSQSLIANTFLVVLLIAIASIAAQFFSSLAIVRMESLVNLRLESALWNHLFTLPLSFFGKHGPSDLINRVSSISEIRKLVSTGILSTSLAFLFSISNILLMAHYQFQLAIVATVFTIISAFICAYLVWRSVALQGPLLEGQAQLADLGLQAVTGMAQVRVGGYEPFIFERWFAGVTRISKLIQRSQTYSNALETLGRILPSLGQVVIFIGFATLINRANSNMNGNKLGIESMSTNDLVSSFVAFQAAYVSFNSQFSTAVVTVSNTLGRLLVLLDRSRLVMFSKSESSQGSGNQQHQLLGGFSVKGIQVIYPGCVEPILTSINFEIEPGTYTAVTGPSGCGKTTLARCLLRLIEPAAGVITADGIDIRDLSLRTYRRQIGVVLQNTPLPSGSIFDVVCAGRSFTREEVWVAIEQSGLADDVKNMSMQLETIINDGASTVSGGQRQRLALARALIGRPRVLLLDEATSALDGATQSLVTRTLESLKITRIAIAHRLSTIESADQILVIRNGTIDEAGSFSELINSKSGYLSRSDSL